MRHNWHKDLIKLASNSRFKTRELFYVVFMREQKVKGAHQYQSWNRGFWAWDMKNAMQQFYGQARGYAGKAGHEYALVARKSGRVLVTTAAFAKDFDYVWNQSNDKSKVDETYADWDSQQLIGLMYRQGIAKVPREWIKNQYSVISLVGGKAVLTSLGTNWGQAWRKYNADFRKGNKPAALILSDGRFYHHSGPKNNWGNFYEAY